jgi:hypothetical protein
MPRGTGRVLCSCCDRDARMPRTESFGRARPNKTTLVHAGATHAAVRDAVRPPALEQRSVITTSGEGSAAPRRMVRILTMSGELRSPSRKEERALAAGAFFRGKK